MNDPHVEYHRRLGVWDADIARLGRLHALISNLRLLAASLVALMLWFAFARAVVSPVWVLLPVAAFGGLVVAHARALNSLERARRAYRLYERGLARLGGGWAGMGADGSRFLDGHPFARDLDLFGRGSLFELINTARTEAGEATLAEWFNAGADPDEVRARQAAVRELRPMLDFREALSVLAAEAYVGRTGLLIAWASSPGAGLGAWAAWLLAGCALVTIALAGVAVSGRGAEPLLVWLVIEYGVAFATRSRVDRALAGLEEAERDIMLVGAVLARIEREPFTAPRLASLRAALQSDGIAPSDRVASLRRLISILDATRNQMFAPIAYPLLVRCQVAVAIDRWRRRYGPAVRRWLEVIGEVEALSAFAAYAFEHPADPFPSVVDRGPLFDAVALGHPLIADGLSVPNDVQLGGDAPHVIVLSGSNMSGKSTLLRSVGVNVVLALSGAPVRASRVSLSRLAIGATLRIDDSLQEGHSRFYTEILRIRGIVDTARGQIPLLFLLDEILHGTNSYDRRIGAEGVVRALVGLGAIGLVTTHDLALTALPASLGPTAANRHFEDRFEDGKLVFDYRMRPGVVDHSNALALMRAIGLDV